MERDLMVLGIAVCMAISWLAQLWPMWRHPSPGRWWWGGDMTATNKAKQAICPGSVAVKLAV